MLTNPMLMGDPLARLARDMDRLFDFVAPAGLGPVRPETLSRWAYPPLNVWQDEQNVYIEAELPGIPMEAVELYATVDTFTIKGRRQITRPEGVSVLRSERADGQFERSMSLPTQIEAEKVSATMRDGVLTVTMTKAQRALPRRIQVSALPEAG